MSQRVGLEPTRLEEQVFVEKQGLSNCLSDSAFHCMSKAALNCASWHPETHSLVAGAHGSV